MRGKDKKTRALRGKYQTGTSWNVGALCHTHNCCLFVYKLCSVNMHTYKENTDKCWRDIGKLYLG